MYRFSAYKGSLEYAVGTPWWVWCAALFEECRAVCGALCGVSSCSLGVWCAVCGGLLKRVS